jgi:hypothetical protein
MSVQLNENSVSLLSKTTVAFNADGTTGTLYTVPTGKRCVLSHATIVAGGDAGPTTSLTLGSNASGSYAADFITSAAILSTLDAQYDSVTIRPIPATPHTTPLKNKSYSAGTLISGVIATQSGTTGNTIYLFGFLYDA